MKVKGESMYMSLFSYLSLYCYSMLGRTNDALIIRYKQILRAEGNFQKFQRELKHFHTADCSLSDDNVAHVVQEQIQLLGK